MCEGLEKSLPRNPIKSKTKNDPQTPLTPSLINYADLDKDVLIVGMVNKIEIWNPTRLDETDKQNLEIDPAAYDELAKNIII